MDFGSVYNGRRILVTGHTGFKGSWLCLWLTSLGAKVTGYALDPPTKPSLFNLCRIDKLLNSVIADVRDSKKFTKTVLSVKPDIVIHMAAQPLVRDSYKVPAATYEINVMGTVNLFEAVRKCNSVRAVINVTTDKCYENKEWPWGYKEDEQLGGFDPYSNSKACSELVTAAYRSSFFNPGEYKKHGVAVASVRAGNVIGGGDWATDRLIPDCVRALLKEQKIVIRNPKAIRPWQYVLEPLRGYLMLADKLYTKGPQYAGAWNFGPEDADAKSVEWVVKSLCEKWGGKAAYKVDKGIHPHEAHCLKLDSSKARNELGWKPKLDLRLAIEKTAEWYKAFQNKRDLITLSIEQIQSY